MSRVQFEEHARNREPQIYQSSGVVTAWFIRLGLATDQRSANRAMIIVVFFLAVITVFILSLRAQPGAIKNVPVSGDGSVADQPIYIQ